MLKENIEYLLTLLGLLPKSVYKMPEIRLDTCRLLLEAATYYVKYHLMSEVDLT